MNTCPICGYNKLERPAFENISKYSDAELEAMHPPYEQSLGMASYEECPSCKFEPGADDNPGTSASVSFAQFRQEWQKSQTESED